MDHFDPSGFLATAMSSDIEPLDRLEALTVLRHNLDVIEAELVQLARRKTSGSWSKIAAALDLRKQSAWAKHHDRCP